MPGILLIRTENGDDAWSSVLHLLGELPGVCTPGQAASVGTPGSAPASRRLIVAEELAWGGAVRATAEEVSAALEQPGIWVPDLVVLTDPRTASKEAGHPLMAFTPSDGAAFWITPRQLAWTYLMLDYDQSDAFDRMREDSFVGVEWEDPEDASELEAAGILLESADRPPRYTRPVRDLPSLRVESDLLVRTDYTDDAAWASFVDSLSQSDDDQMDDFSDWITLIDDPVFDGATPEQVMAQMIPNADSEEMIADVLLVADSVTMGKPDSGVLVVALTESDTPAFRVDADEVGLMVVNLALGNQGIEDWSPQETYF
ncbi:hypothetical protein GTX14_22175 [Streptomyces sp. SID4944]|nr:hypothetical protein [Streptomyces sp. SID4944]